MPTVSVVVATYRRDTSLLRALDSVTVQTLKDFEIILVDDNGDPAWNDKVQHVVNRFKRKYPDVKLICITNSSNLGSARTRNVGIEASQGEYVCFLDDDDVYCPDRIKNQLIPMQREIADYRSLSLPPASV